MSELKPFLAVWSSGQDQVANIKRQLRLLLPACKIFLDVDDLADIGKLEQYVLQSQCVLIFLSSGYFFRWVSVAPVKQCCINTVSLTMHHSPFRCLQ